MKLSKLIRGGVRTYVGPKGIYLEDDSLGVLYPFETPLSQNYFIDANFLKIWNKEELAIEEKSNPKTTSLVIKNPSEKIIFNLTPVDPIFPYKDSIEGSQLKFLESLNRVSFVQKATTDLRLRCVHLENNYLVATDRSRLAIQELPEDLKIEVNLPEELISVLGKLEIESAKLIEEENLLFLESEEFKITSKKFMPQFVPWKKIDRDLEHKARINPLEWIEALEKFALLEIDRIRIEIKTNEIELKGENPTAAYSAKFDSDSSYSFTLVFNLQFLLEGLKIGKPDILEYGIPSYVVFKNQKEAWCYVVCPLVE